MTDGYSLTFLFQYYFKVVIHVVFQQQKQPRSLDYVEAGAQPGANAMSSTRGSVWNIHKLHFKCGEIIWKHGQASSVQRGGGEGGAFMETLLNDRELAAWVRRRRGSPWGVNTEAASVGGISMELTDTEMFWPNCSSTKDRTGAHTTPHQHPFLSPRKPPPLPPPPLQETA